MHSNESRLKNNCQHYHNCRHSPTHPLYWLCWNLLSVLSPHFTKQTLVQLVLLGFLFFCMRMQCFSGFHPTSLATFLIFFFNDSHSSSQTLNVRKLRFCPWSCSLPIFTPLVLLFKLMALNIIYILTRSNLNLQLIYLSKLQVHVSYLISPFVYLTEIWNSNQLLTLPCSNICPILNLPHLRW